MHCALVQGQNGFSALGMLILKLHWYLKLLEIAKVISTRKSNFYAIIEKKVQKLISYGNAPTYHL